MQTRRQSMIEAVVNILVGITVAFISNIVILGAYDTNLTISQNLGITLWMTFISLIRSYSLRRYFNWKHRTTNEEE